MGEEKSDSENLEFLIGRARKQRRSIRKVLIDYFTSVSEKEKVPIIGLDSKNTIVYVNDKVKEIAGEEKFESLSGKTIYDFLPRGETEKCKSLIEEAHMLGYNRLHFTFLGIDFTADLKRDEQGKYLGAVVRLRRVPRLKLWGSKLYRSRISIGKAICDAEGNPVCEMDVVEAFYARELLDIRLDFLVKTINEDNMKQVLKEVVDYLANATQKGDSVDIEIKAKRLTKPAIRLLAFMQYDNKRRQVLTKVFGREMDIKLYARSRYEKRFGNYVSDFESQKLTLDDTKLEYLEAAVEEEAKKLSERQRIPLGTPKEPVYNLLLESFRTIFMAMLKKAKIYQLLPGEVESDPITARAEEFLNRLKLNGQEIYKFHDLLASKIDKKKLKSVLREIYDPVFERYMLVQSFYLFRQHKKE